MSFEYNGKLIIFTQFYKFQTTSAYANSLLITGMVLKELGINFDFWAWPGESHIERGINMGLTDFANDKEATDFLNIDSDESWDAESVVKLLRHPQEMVCGVYKMTNKWDQYTGILERDEDGGFIGKYTSDDSAILRAERIPAGFMRIKKEPLLKYIETYPNDYYYIGEKKVYRFFWNEIIDNQFTGMDFAFSDKLKKLGYDLWIEPTCQIGHWGIIEHKGNLDKYLREQKAITDVQAMGKEIENAHGHT